MIFTIAFLTLLAVAIGLGVYRFCTRGGAAADRLLLAATPFILIVFLVGVAATSQYARMLDWNNARLAPAVALGYGYKLYYPATSGPVLNHIYTPISALVYYPATLANHPDAALVCAAAISTLLYLAPIVAIVLATTRANAVNRWQLVLLLVCFSWAVSRLIPSLDSTMIHADAPAISFAGFACFFTIRSLRRVKHGSKLSFNLVLGCLFATLSFWSKQTMVPLLVTIPVWLFVTIGIRRAAETALCLLLMSLAALVLVSLHVPLETFFFNIVEIPSQHPWHGDSAWQLVKEFLHLEQFVIWLCVVPILAIVVWTTRRADGRLWQLRRLCRENPWTLIVLAALFTFPTCVLTKVKVGGTANAFAPASYLFLLANVWILSRSWSFQRPIPIGDCGKMTVTVLALLLALVVSQDFASRLRYSFQPSRTEIAYDFIVSQPHTAYFPWHPLAHLMVEDRLYHFDYGLYDRYLAGHSVDPSHLLAGIPQNATLLCFPPQNDTPEHDRVLREMFPRRVDIESLPGWECYERIQ